MKRLRISEAPMFLIHSFRPESTESGRVTGVEKTRADGNTGEILMKS